MTRPEAVRHRVGDIVETLEDVHDGRLDGPLYRIVNVRGILCDVGRINAATGALDGKQTTQMAATGLRRARPVSLRRHEARAVRSVLAQLRRAAANDAEDFAIVEELVDRSERLAAMTLGEVDPDDATAVTASGWVSEIDGAQVVQIDTAESAGRVRVFLNDGPIWDGDPDTDTPPGAHYQGQGWTNDAVAEHLLVRAESEDAPARCDECGAATDELVSAQHLKSCSLYPGAGGRRP